MKKNSGSTRPLSTRTKKAPERLGIDTPKPTGTTNPPAQSTSSSEEESSENAETNSDTSSRASAHSPAPGQTTSESESEEEVGQIIQPAPPPPRTMQRKFVSPPKFRAGQDEDALEWLERYEATGAYNQWQNDDLATNFGMYLEGAARKWFVCTTLPNDWGDTPAAPGIPAQNGQPAVNPTPIIHGLRSRFLQEFQEENYALFQEAKLRNRVQGLEEPTTSYYYDVIDLCRSVNPTMPEAQKLENLFRGLRPTLLEKIYPLRPKTCVEFLAAVKIHTEASMMANRKGWTATIMNEAKEKQMIAAATYQEHSATAGNQGELWKALKELQEKIKNMQTTAKPENNSASSKKEGGRSATGKPKCYFCHKVGHIARKCFKNPESEQYKGEPKAEGKADGKAATKETAPLNLVIPKDLKTIEKSEESTPLLRLDIKKLITEEVVCGGHNVKAVIDTGAALSVIHPEFLKTTTFTKEKWEGPRVIMANGTTAEPLGGAEISIEHQQGKAKGLALVLEMDGIDLLLGNDFLKQFKKVRIDYHDAGNLITLGDTPLAAISVESTPLEAKPIALVAEETCNIPPLSIAGIAITFPTEIPGPWIITPSKKLMETKSISVGHALLADNLLQVPVANLSKLHVQVQKGTTLGHLEKYEPEKEDNWSTMYTTKKNQDGTIHIHEAKSLDGVMDPEDVEKRTTYLEDFFTNSVNEVTRRWQEEEQRKKKKRFEEAIEAVRIIGEQRRKKQDEIDFQKAFQQEILPQIGETISEKQREALTDLLYQHADVFALTEGDLGNCSLTEHAIDTGNAEPIRQYPYKTSWKERKIIQEYVDKMLEQDIIEPCDSPWSSPVVLAKKPDGTWRFCADYRKLNAITVRDVYPMPCVPSSLSRLEGAKFFSIMDVRAGFHQIKLREQDKAKTAFVTNDGLYQFKVMAFGLMNAPSTFQRLMDVVLAGLRWTSCLVYMDDIVVYSTTFEEHLERLDQVFSCLENAGLKLKIKKCQFAQKRLRVLGHIVSEEGIGPDPDKLASVANFPSPTLGHNLKDKVKRVQSFIGLCSYYRRHIHQFALIAKPLTELIKQDAPFIWGEAQQNSFEKLKTALTTAPVLIHPNYEKEMEVIPDACGYGIGGILAQKINGVEHPVAYASRLLTKSEQNYSITELECLALVWCLKKFRGFIWGMKVNIITDHQALCWLLTKRDLAGRLARWSLAIQEYDIQIMYRSGKLHDNADCLSRYPIEDAPQEQDADSCLMLMPEQEENLQPEKSTILIAEQQKVPAWNKIMKHLQAGHKRQKNFVLVEGRIYHQTFKDRTAYQRLCLPKSHREQVLKAMHDDVVSGHLGVNRTLAKISSRFFWPKKATDVQKYVQACTSCQGRKGVPKKPAGLLQCIRVSQPFEKVGIDLLGPFPLSHSGNKMIIVAVDYLTKWVELQALPSGKAEDVAEFLVKRIFLRHGSIGQLISDKGKCFLAEVTQSIIKKFHTNHKTTSSYHPQANGQCERMNHTLAAMLSMYVSGDHKDWDETLEYVGFAYNTARQESTGYSPFYLLYGREPVLPIDLELYTDANPLLPQEEANKDYASRMASNLKAARLLVSIRMEHVKQRDKKQYDEKHREQQFEAGDLVLVYKPFRKVGKAEKLLHRWLGPFRVVRRTTPVNYEVINLSGKGKTDIVHVVSMKPFTKQIEDDTRETQERAEEESETDIHPEPPAPSEQLNDTPATEVQTETTEHEREAVTDNSTTENKKPQDNQTAENEEREEQETETHSTPQGMRRSNRIRRRPLRLMPLLIPYLLFCMTLTSPASC